MYRHTRAIHAHAHTHTYTHTHTQTHTQYSLDPTTVSQNIDLLQTQPVIQGYLPYQPGLV